MQGRVLKQALSTRLKGNSMVTKRAAHSTALKLSLLLMIAVTAVTVSAQDPLPSWNDGPAKQAIHLAQWQQRGVDTGRQQKLLVVSSNPAGRRYLSPKQCSNSRGCVYWTARVSHKAGASAFA
jgi:hypothetical protein